ncbi:MAG: glucan biosynthesis protein [Verrucomicrobiota bacterium]|nr:glucan biosynthesis protein [Verrucomicrobiota bacterium]
MWRGLILAVAAMTVANTVSLGDESAVVDLNYVARQALDRARRPFRSPSLDLPSVLRTLNYDQYRQIRFRRGQALWTSGDLPFRVEFFHPGYLYQDPVHLYEFTSTHLQRIRFVRDFFDYGNLHVQNNLPTDMGYAGFRILYQLNATNVWDELGAFLGASYFRLLGRDQRYGQSARGLAINCGEATVPEEFPLFTDWWLGKPAKGDTDLVLYALLDSVSCTGAYEFHIDPGNITAVDVSAILYFRSRKVVLSADTNAPAVNTLGLAPLTSMFWFGKNSERKFDDYRPEVHDADGLLMKLNDGRTLWSPLDNPASLRNEVFPAPNIKGFGLLQRERDFADYQDSFNRYDLEPSVWIQPHGNWGPGAIHLVELSSVWEGEDNVVAFWAPATNPVPLQPYRFGYTMFWEMGDADTRLSPNRVVSTRIGVDPADSTCRIFMLDFKGQELGHIPLFDPPRAIVNCGTNATLVNTQVFPCPELGAWRVELKMRPQLPSPAPVHLDCTLEYGTNIVSETWTYQWNQP